MQCISGPVWMSFYLTCNQAVKYHITCYRIHEAAQLVTKIHCTFITWGKVRGRYCSFPTQVLWLETKRNIAFISSCLASLETEGASISLVVSS